MCLVREDDAMVGEDVNLFWGNNGMVGEAVGLV